MQADSQRRSVRQPDTPEVARKREDERRTMLLMISLYCHGQHHPIAASAELCSDCDGLWSYAKRRIDFCIRMDEKTFCSSCPQPCFRGTHADMIRCVMRYSGPRMLLHDPIRALRHAWSRLRS
jgi:hypothetical protein